MTSGEYLNSGGVGRGGGKKDRFGGELCICGTDGGGREDRLGVQFCMSGAGDDAEGGGCFNREFRMGGAGGDAGEGGCFS